jgi:hypothetical protein
MAKTVLERCDKVVGVKEGSDYFAAIGSYKTGEGAAQETHYALGAYLSVPAKFKTGDADVDKALLLWCKRMTSADNAGIPGKIKAGEITIDEAAAVIQSYDGEDFLVRLNETKVREGGGAGKIDSTETKIVKKIDEALRKKHASDGIVGAKYPIPRATDPPLTEKGKINFNAWAKILRAENHQWSQVAQKQVERDMAKIAKDFE